MTHTHVNKGDIQFSKHTGTKNFQCMIHAHLNNFVLYYMQRNTD